ncbi:MAG: DNA polymerase IV [Caldilineaceae bacterium]|nr:DNA polymerase IV [Caldilineaceae bacterium]
MDYNCAMIAHRTIMHLDLDAFYCAVEEQQDPSLRGRAFAVGGSPNGRGVVTSCSYAARKYGVHSAMPMAQAVRACPDLLVVPTNFSAYRTVSRKVMSKLRLFTPLVEQLSVDEAFLDVTNLPGSGETLARELQASIREELGLPASLGVASNKLVAKIADNIGKDRAAQANAGYPNAILVVPPGQEAAFLAPLPCRELWGVGPKTAERLHELGIERIGDIVRFPAHELTRLFGKHGTDLIHRAQGLDDRPVCTEREAKSVSAETTFSRDIADGQELRRTLQRLADDVARRLRKSGLAGSTIKLKLRWTDFTTPTRQLTLARATDDAMVIYTAVETLFRQLWPPGTPVRLLGVGVNGLAPQPYQPTLWEMETDEFLQAEEQMQRRTKLRDVIRELDGRYGLGTLRRGDNSQ